MGGVDVGTIALLFGVAVVAACFDAIAGGGGLLTVPALLIAGFDPVSAIATNKLQGAVGTWSATYAFARRGLVDWRSAWPIAAAAGLASIAGALSVSFVTRPLLNALVPIVLVAIALYFATARGMRDEDASARLPPALFAGTVAPLVGFYDGVFGPGAGSFYMVGFVSLLGLSIVRATAQTKFCNAASNFGSLCLFAATGAVSWPVGLAMAAGALIGGQIGSILAIRLGARLIRPLLVSISCVMAIRLLADPANPLRQIFARVVGF